MSWLDYCMNSDSYWLLIIGTEHMEEALLYFTVVFRWTFVGMENKYGFIS